MKNSKVTLYTHWGATELINDVQAAMKLKERWDDEDYLARIIFDKILHGDTGTTGYGIGTGIHGDIWRLVTVDVDKQTIEVNDDPDGSSGHGSDGVKFNGSFEDFIKWKIPED